MMDKTIIKIDDEKSHTTYIHRESDSDKDFSDEFVVDGDEDSFSFTIKKENKK